MTQEKLDKTLRSRHPRLCGREFEGMSFYAKDLAGVPMQGANFTDCDFRLATLDKLYDCQFTRCRFEGTRLSGAAIDGCGFYECEMNSADMQGAHVANSAFHSVGLCNAYIVVSAWFRVCVSDIKLCRAMMQHIELAGCKFNNADLFNANVDAAVMTDVALTDCRFDASSVRYAMIRGGSMTRVSFKGASLSGAIIKDVSACDVDFTGAMGAKCLAPACPETGAFDAWKRCGDHIVRLHVPADARRSSAFGDICRCDKAEVVEILDLCLSPADVAGVRSDYDPQFMYTVGRTVSVPDFDTDRWREASRGIHFYMSPVEAVRSGL